MNQFYRSKKARYSKLRRRRRTTRRRARPVRRRRTTRGRFGGQRFRRALRYRAHTVRIFEDAPFQIDVPKYPATYDTHYGLNSMQATSVSSIQPYLDLYEQFKVVSQTFTVRLNDSTQMFAETSYTDPEVHSCYRPDSNSRAMTIDQIMNYPSSRHRLLKPFQKIKFKVYPQWNQYMTTNEQPSEAAKFMQRAKGGQWVDCTQFNNLMNNGCANGFCVSYRGGDTSSSGSTGMRLRYSIATVLKFRMTDNKAGYKP